MSNDITVIFPTKCKASIMKIQIDLVTDSDTRDIASFKQRK